ncbi:MAG: succinylglutamate desuccinylase/aspartoacylase family protein [Proteobacteria bacterium]|nr:succinylglutamate desuccinylase/aspartoacylase family protein [Pseudomonadota bacterium]
MQWRHARALVFVVLTSGVGFLAAREFNTMREPDHLIPGAGVTRVTTLGEYHSDLLGASSGTPIYVLEGAEPGATLLVLGGVHPNEASGFLAAVVILEHATVTRGRLIVIPQASWGGYTCTDPMEAYPEHYAIPLANGERLFRYGSRGMNPVDQWPDPLVYLHHPSGQQLSGIETRNLNRCFPGRSDGTYTERVAYAIMQVLRTEEVDIAVDLHEAAPEYPVINTIVAHEKGTEIAATAILNLEFDDLQFTLERSPVRFRGLSHREWGDATKAYAFLMETGNIMQGRLRGKTSSELLLTGLDRMYLKAAAIGMVKIPYDSSGVPLDVRVGRHLQGLRALIDAYNDAHPERAITVTRLPSFAECTAEGVGAFLNPPNPEPSSNTGDVP